MRWWWGSAFSSTSGARACAARRVAIRKTGFMAQIVALAAEVPRGLKPWFIVGCYAALKRRSSTVFPAFVWEERIPVKSAFRRFALL